jgi:hypothetical protein
MLDLPNTYRKRIIMATTEERLAQMTTAIKEVIIEMMDPGASRNRLERSILPDLYRTMDEGSRREIARRAKANCFNDEERQTVSDRINDAEFESFGSKALEL